MQATREQTIYMNIFQIGHRFSTVGAFTGTLRSNTASVSPGFKNFLSVFKQRWKYGNIDEYFSNAEKIKFHKIEGQGDMVHSF